MCILRHHITVIQCAIVNDHVIRYRAGIIQIGQAHEPVQIDDQIAYVIIFRTIETAESDEIINMTNGSQLPIH